MAKLNVAVVAFDRISPFHLSVPCAVFGDTALEESNTPFNLRVVAAEAGPLTTTAGFGITVNHQLDALHDADIVIFPSWRDPDETPPPRLLEAVQTAHARGVRVVGLCLGAYVLASAEVLDGRKATTHWAWTQDFATKFTHIDVKPNVLYIDDGRLSTSAGTAAGLDCCLHILREYVGLDTANQVARRLVLPTYRQGSQVQYIDRPLPKRAGADSLTDMLDWIRQHIAHPHTLDDLSQRANMSKRTFTRKFQQCTGSTVGAWLLAERLACAQTLLETTSLSIDTIAENAGFGSAASLRSYFSRCLATSPSAYRKAFHG